VNFRLSQLDSPLTDIQWCGPSKGDIPVILTQRGSIYRSEDKGLNWVSKSEHFQKTGYLETEKDEEVGTVSRMIVSPADKNVIIFLGTQGINWITKDCGLNIVAMNQGRKINEFQFHPTEPTWVLAAAFTLCEDFGDSPCEIFKEVFVSFDLGEKWKVLQSYVVQFAWALVNEAFLETVPK